MAVLAVAALSSQTARSTPDGLRLLRGVQEALGGAGQIGAVRDYEEVIRAQAWDSAGNALGEVRKRTRWSKASNAIRLDQRGPRGTYVLYFEGAADAGWELLPDLTGPDPYQTTGKRIALAAGELEFARSYLSGFELNSWLADRLPGYVVTSPQTGRLRIEHGGHATDFTLDAETGVPLTSNGVSLADPDRPVPSEMRYSEWKAIGGIRFPMRRANYLNGLKRGEVTTEDIRLNAGLRRRDLATPPADSRPDLPGR